MSYEKINWLPHSPLPNDPDRPEYRRRQEPPADSEAADLPEITLQSRCFLWAWNSYPENRRMLFHVQNKARNKIEGAKFKAMGVVSGVSDLILVTEGRVVFIELKTGKGVQSEEQQEFEGRVKERGHSYVIIRTEAEFKKLVTLLWGPPQNSAI